MDAEQCPLFCYHLCMCTNTDDTSLDIACGTCPSCLFRGRSAVFTHSSAYPWQRMWLHEVYVWFDWTNSHYCAAPWTNPHQLLRKSFLFALRRHRAAWRRLRCRFTKLCVYVRWCFVAKSRDKAIEEARSQWCCENVVWLSSFWDSGAPKADSSRLRNDLSFHCILFSYTVCEVSYSVLNLMRVGIRSVFLM